MGGCTKYIQGSVCFDAPNGPTNTRRTDRRHADMQALPPCLPTTPSDASPPTRHACMHLCIIRPARRWRVGLKTHPVGLTGRSVRPCLHPLISPRLGQHDRTGGRYLYARSTCVYVYAWPSHQVLSQEHTHLSACLPRALSSHGASVRFTGSEGQTEAQWKGSMHPHPDAKARMRSTPTPASTYTVRELVWGLIGEWGRVLFGPLLFSFLSVGLLFFLFFFQPPTNQNGVLPRFQTPSGRR